MIGGYADFQKWVAICNLVSGSGPIPPEFKPPGGRYSPSVTAVAGLTSASIVMNDAEPPEPMALYEGNSLDAGGVIHVTAKVQITTNGFAGQRQFRITNPIPGNFTILGQAQICGLESIVESPGAEGNTGSGWNGNLTSDPVNDAIIVTFETSQVSTTNFVDVSWKYEIQ